MDAITSMNYLPMAKDENTNSKDKKEYSERDQWNDDLDIMPLYYSKPESKKPIVEKAKFDIKKKKSRFWALSITLLFGALAFFIFVMRDSLYSSEKQLAEDIVEVENISNNTENLSIENTEQIEESNFIEDTVIIENISEEENMEMEMVIDEDPKNYHIVIGSFEQESNAESFIENLQDKNENTTIFLFNGVYRVSYNTYSDSDEAEIEIDYIRNSINLSAWIVYMR